MAIPFSEQYDPKALTLCWQNQSSSWPKQLLSSWGQLNLQVPKYTFQTIKLLNHGCFHKKERSLIQKSHFYQTGFTISDTNVETPIKVPIFSYKLKNEEAVFCSNFSSLLSLKKSWVKKNTVQTPNDLHFEFYGFVIVTYATSVSMLS